MIGDNKPLTIEQIQEMDGQRVWLSSINDGVENFSDELCGWYRVVAKYEWLATILIKCDDEKWVAPLPYINYADGGFRAYKEPQIL